MGLNTATALKNAVTAWENEDQELGQKVVDGDEDINEQETHLEGKSAQIIALQQPVAGDLRKIVAILKASSDVERLADHTVHIARKAVRSQNSPRKTKLDQLVLKMADNDLKMLQDVLQAYGDLDDQAAIAVSEKDHLTDQYLQELNQLILEEIKADHEFVIEGFDYMKLGNHLERIGDYVTNIAEWIVYTTRGRITELGRSDY